MVRVFYFTAGKPQNRKTCSWCCHTLGNNFWENYMKYEGWNFNSGNYLFATDTK